MDRLQNIETFVRVAQTQSFAEAARQLRVARSVVTTRIQQLEDYLGAPLFHRSTRVVRLSETGQAFLADCTELVGRANDIVDQMRDVKGAPAGNLRLHALPGFVLGHLAQVLRDFQERYPEITLDVSVSDAMIDPVKEGMDCVLQIFPTTSEELVSRRLFPVRRVFCATPSYLKKHGIPRHPNDLFGHRLGLYSKYPSRDKWTFYRDGDKTTLELKAAMLTNSVHLLNEYALENAGIVCVPTLVAANGVLDGRLKLVLCDYQLSTFWLSVVYPRTLRGAYKLRLFIEALSSSFAGGEPPWDQALIEQGVLSKTLIEA
ncbi:LysR family transcriptional regulator [Rhodoferax ferrireducens]|uniref:LysR family transcriptional regulator n=1 Tax=Rhodoferax ferrireducens TaxID=192843 RepID=UPI000E0D9DBC|nr:LysR family transcriptional regulator [Rhodoferax ferrireducens]